jgi:hypothetical protein
MRGARGAGTDGARALATVCQAVDAAELSVDRLRKSKRIQAGPKLLQHGDLRGVTCSGGHEPIQRGLGTVIATPEPGADADFSGEFHRGLEQVHHEPELMAVEVIHRLEGLWGVIPIPAQELADVRPYLKALRRSSSVLTFLLSLFGRDAVELVTLLAAGSRSH